MSGIISGNMVGGAAPLRTLIITDADGNEVVGVVTGSEVVFTAKDNDVREGMVYASDNGVSVGTKNIPAYRTTQGEHLIDPGASFMIPLAHYNKYDYTKFQCVVCKLNTSLYDSVYTDKIVIDDYVYATNSVDVLSHVTKNADLKCIDFNIVNDSEDFYIIRYFTYKEEE